MNGNSQSDNERILQLVGAIVLTSQDVEHCLKVALPFVASKDASLGAALRRHEKLKRRPLGDLVGSLTQASSLEPPDLKQYLAQLVDDRNRLVHHFNETYGQSLATGNYKDVIASLEAQLVGLRSFRTGTEQLALFVMEALRDITFRNTPEFEQMASICASFRQRVAS